jgi:hypothetical protein
LVVTVEVKVTMPTKAKEIPALVEAMKTEEVEKLPAC